MMTLSQLTAVIEPIRETLHRRYAVGKTGSSRRGRTGDKLHLLFIVDDDLHKQHFETGVCSGRGTEIAGLDTDAITCEKCLQWLIATSARAE